MPSNRSNATKKLESSSIFNYVNKELGKSDATHTLTETNLTDDRKLEIKYPLEKIPY